MSSEKCHREKQKKRRETQTLTQNAGYERNAMFQRHYALAPWVIYAC